MKKENYWIVDECLRAGMKPKDIMKEYGIPSSSFYRIALKLGYDLNNNRERKLDQFRDEILALREAGTSYRQIARDLGLNTRTLREWCKDNGCEESDEEKERHRATTHQANTREEVEAMVSKAGYEYLDGYVRTKSIISVRCLACGSVLSMSYQSFLCGNKPRCPECEEAERERRRKEETEARAIMAEDKRIAKLKRARFVQASVKACPICNSLFVGDTMCCSDRCARRRINRTRDVNRRKRISSAMVDRDITLEEVARREKNICYLCGNKVDWNDYVMDGTTFIAGNNYPSIEHVTPLSKGGAHSWENVKLAHRICNSLKSDLITPAAF